MNICVKFMIFSNVSYETANIFTDNQISFKQSIVFNWNFRAQFYYVAASNDKCDGAENQF